MIGKLYSMPGMGFEFDLNADGTAFLSFLDQQETGTWTQDGDKISITADGDTITGKVSDGQLVLESSDAGLQITLSRTPPDTSMGFFNFEDVYGGNFNYEEWYFDDENLNLQS